MNRKKKVLQIIVVEILDGKLLHLAVVGECLVLDDLVDVGRGDVEERNDGDVGVGVVNDGSNGFHVLGERWCCFENDAVCGFERD